MKAKLIYEIKSFLMTFIAFLAVDGYMELVNIYNGNLTRSVLTALGIAALRSAVKALLQLLFPMIFTDLTVTPSNPS